MRKPSFIALFPAFAFLLAGCAEGPFLGTKIEAVQTSHQATVCYHPSLADQVEIERVARDACWDDGRRQAVFIQEQRLQCRLTAPSQSTFRCIMAQKTRPTTEDRGNAWDADATMRNTYKDRLLPPPDGRS